jgi:RNA polymerase sigma factor (sigma-70 family)
VDDEQLLALDEALDHLALHDATKAQVVKLRFFAGLTIGQVARVLGVSEPTVKRHWAYARAWLFREMNS